MTPVRLDLDPESWDDAVVLGSTTSGRWLRPIEKPSDASTDQDEAPPESTE